MFFSPLLFFIYLLYVLSSISSFNNIVQLIIEGGGGGREEYQQLNSYADESNESEDTELTKTYWICEILFFFYFSFQ